MKLIIRSVLAVRSVVPLFGAQWEDRYQLEDIALPKNAPPEVGGISFDSAGDLYLCLRRGDVFRATPRKDPLLNYRNDLEGLEARRVHQLNLADLKAADGTAVHNRMFCYTANQLR